MTDVSPRARTNFRPALVCALAGAAVGQFFGNATHGYIDTTSMFYWWGYQWFDPGAETQHGLLIVALSGWLFWRNLDGNGETRPERRIPCDAGGAAPVVAMVAGLVLHALGFAAQQTRLSIVAALVFAWGVLRLAGGRRWSGAAAFPLVFLVFALPLNALDTVGFWLRHWVIDASARLAHAAGVGVVQNGTQLLAPDGRYNYDVAAACSGVRSLMALAALSLLAGYLNFRSWWRRGALFLWCFPLVYLGNLARITAIVFAAHWGGQGWGDRAHDAMGYGVFALVLGGVLAAVSALRRWLPEKEEAKNDARSGENSATEGKAAADAPEPVGRLTADRRPWRVAVVVGVLAVAEMLFLHQLATRPPRGNVGVALAGDGRNPVDLPALLADGWVGLPTPVTAAEREILPADTGYSRMDYVSSRDRRHVFLSIVLSGRDRTSIHRPELCLLGQGWTIADATETRFAVPQRMGGAAAGAESFPATLLRVRREVVTRSGREVVPQLVAYWFVGGDTVVATHWQRLARDAWNRVAHARADRWAYVLLQTDATDGEPAALARMQAVLNETLPTFQPSRLVPSAR